MRSFLRWWFAQLAGLLPDILTRAALHRPNAAILEVGSETASLLLRENGETSCLAQSTADETGIGELGRVLAALKSPPPSLLLRFPVDHVLTKHLTLPVAARRDLKDLLGYEIDRETPFEREEVYWNYAVERQDNTAGRIEVNLALVPRSFADPLVAMTRRCGLHPAAVETSAAGGIVIPLDGVKPARWFHGERTQMALAAAAGVLLLIAAAIPFLYQEWEIASADAALAALEVPAREAIALRSAADLRTRTAAFLEKKSLSNGAAVGTLAAVTRIVPDDSYLTALTLRDGRLTLSGLSPSAADLVGLFAHAPGFKEPTFESPVVGSDSGDLETFTIAVRLAQAGSS